MRRVAALVGLAVLGAGACSTTIDGRAVPDPQAPTSSSAPAPGPGERPATLPLDGVDLCKLYPANLEFQPGYQWPPISDDKGCVLVAPEGVYTVADDPNPISAFINSTKVKATEFNIVGYPAIIGYDLPDSGESCFVNIDVQDEANLEISIVDPDAPGSDLLCPKAKQLANVAMGLLPTLTK